MLKQIDSTTQIYANLKCVFTLCESQQNDGKIQQGHGNIHI